jgi:DNA-binding NarL/FixJ family response regulator
VKRRVLVIEPQARVRREICELLEASDGFEVVGVAGAEHAAMEWLQEHAGCWDLAIVDLLLAEGFDRDFLSRCQSDPDAGHVVVFSEALDPAMSHRWVAAGAGAVISRQQFPALCTYVRGLGGQPHALPH